jgi:transposase
MMMGLCLLVYTLAKRQIRTAVRESKSTVKITWANQLTAPLYAGFFHAFSLFI